MEAGCSTQWDRVQNTLAACIKQHDDVDWHVNDGLRLVGGLDVSFYALRELTDGRCSAREGAVACLVVLSFPQLQLLYEDYEEGLPAVPYCPGYLAFRECPLYAPLLQRAAATHHVPQVVLVDGCGVLHPRRCGSASQLGVLAGVPTIGVAKNLLETDGLSRREVEAALLHACGAAAEPTHPGSSEQAGDNGAVAAMSNCRQRQSREGGAAGPCCVEGAPPTAQPGVSLQCSGASKVSDHSRDSEIGGVSGVFAEPGVVLLRSGASGVSLGAALRRGTSRRPLYVSVGHRVSLRTAVEVVRRCCLYNTPEPLRQADIRSRARALQLGQRGGNAGGGDAG